MYVSLVLLVGHLYLAVIRPTTRHALRGMTLGTVSEEWALEYHRKWVEDQSPPLRSPAPPVGADVPAPH